MILFDGAVGDVTTVGRPTLLDAAPGPLRRRSPQWWWPTDRAWFVASEIDDPWSYVAGSAALIARVRSLDIESIEVAHGDIR